jgi:hypothetical protein
LAPVAGLTTSSARDPSLSPVDPVLDHRRGLQRGL